MQQCREQLAEQPCWVALQLPTRSCNMTLQAVPLLSAIASAWTVQSPAQPASAAAVCLAMQAILAVICTSK
jgi:hypothetical protein